MRPRKLFAGPLVWAVAILILLISGWGAGALYWHIRISRALAHLHDNAPSTVRNEVAYRSSYWLPHARSRSLPYIYRDLQEAALKKDPAWFLVLEWAGIDAYNAARSEDVGKRAFPGSQDDLSTLGAHLEFIYHTKIEGSWEKERSHYPPWWMWWDGRYRRP